MTVIDRPALGAILWQTDHLAAREQQLVEGRAITASLRARTRAFRQLEQLMAGWIIQPLPTWSGQIDRVAGELEDTAAGLRVMAAGLEALPHQWMLDDAGEDE